MLFIASAIWYNWEKQMERWGALFDREGGERAVCGQYALWLDNPLAAQIIDRLNRKSVRPFEQGDQRPGMLCPVEHLSDNRLEINWMRWGFPSPTGGALIINARCETAARLPMFRQAVRFGRCLIPSSGFYEWRRLSGGTKSKEKHFLRQGPIGQPVYMAGLFANLPGCAQPCFVILTQSANAFAARLHHRMPLILPEAGQRRAYLGSEIAARQLMEHPPELNLVEQGGTEQMSFL